MDDTPLSPCLEAVFFKPLPVWPVPWAYSRPACCRPRPQRHETRDPFIETLIAQMTLEEKAGQLSLFFDHAREDAPNINPVQAAKTLAEVQSEIAAGRVGGLFNGIGTTSGRALQRIAVEESRLKISLVFAADVIHGLRTVFPVPLGEAAAFDADLAERTARAAALEATSVGVQWTFAPIVDGARDQRWGRVVEGAGEDTYLGRVLAAARERGFQGRDLRDPDTMLATVKHFAAYGAVSGGMEYNSVDMSEATLHDVHLPPFKAGLDAGALSVMSAFNDINGIPATAHHGLLTGVLRQQWAFRGLVVSDFTSDAELVAHGVAADDKDAARLSILAGWYLGSESGHALADLIFGDHNPSGRLPVSFPQASGQRHYYYNHRSTGRPQLKPDEARFKSRYLEVDHRALYPFGHGLNYGEVAYGVTQVSTATLAWKGEVSVSVSISNRGRRPVREVAQLYIHQRVARSVRPVREMRGFQALALESGQSATVNFVLRKEDLAYAGPDGRPVIEPGMFDVTVAPNAVAGHSAKLQLTGV